MSDAEDEPEVDLEAPGVVSSPCEFCGHTYYIDPENMRVMHDLPMCPQFETYEPLNFLRENRKIKQAVADKKGNN